MSQQIPTGFSEQYTTDVRLLLQQIPSRFREAVMVDTGVVGEGAVPVEQVAPVNAVKKTTRHSDTPRIDTPHDKRWVYPEEYEWSDLIDKGDALKAIANFQGPYVQNGAAAMRRAQDDEVISALFSDTTKTGAGGATTTDWTSFVSANAGHLIANGGVGLTTGKLKDGLEALQAAEVDVESDMVFAALSAKQMTDLRGQSEYINWDFTGARILEGAAMKPFMGINFIHSERLAATGSDRRVPMWAKSGMNLSIWSDVTGEVDRIPGKSYSTQVYAHTMIGATRTEEKRVVEIRCTES